MHTSSRNLAVAGASVGLMAMLPAFLFATTPVSPRRVSLTLQNDRTVPVTVYLEQGSFDQRLGTVPGDAIATLPLPKEIVWDGSAVQVYVHPKDGFGLATRDFTVRPGVHVAVLVPPSGGLAPTPAEPVMRDPDPASRATSLTVRNDGGGQVEVFGEHGMFDAGLGTVAPHSTATLLIPGWLINREGVVLDADARNGMDFHTRPMWILRGHHLGMIVPAS